LGKFRGPFPIHFRHHRASRSSAISQSFPTLRQQDLSALSLRNKQFLTTTLFGGNIHLAPEPSEVSHRRPKRKKDDYIKRKLGPSRYPLMVNADHQKRNRNDLPEGLGFAEFTRLYRVAFYRRDTAQPGHGKLAAYQQHHQPTRNHMLLNQGNQSGRHKKFICNRIEQCSDGGDLTPPARKIAVEQIGNGGSPKNYQGDDIICDDSAVPMEYDFFLDQHCNQEGNEENPRDREGIREVHRLSRIVEIPSNSIFKARSHLIQL